jgi:hypothetical protein
MRFSIPLPATLLYAKDGTVYFSVQSTGFSLFAITGTPSGRTPVTAVTAQAASGSPAKEQSPVQVAKTQVPTVTQTPIAPATAALPPGPSPLLNVVLVIAAIGVLAGGGFLVRRWWIRRQNPALFEEED